MMANLSMSAQFCALTKVSARLAVLAVATMATVTLTVPMNCAQADAVRTENATRPLKYAYVTMDTQAKIVRSRHALKNARSMELAMKRLENVRAL